MRELGNIPSRLKALRSKVATALAIDGGARLAGMLLAVVAVSFTVDRIFKLETGARVVILIGMLAALGWTVYRYLVRRLSGVPGEDPLAIAVERRFPELGDRLISALQLSRESDPERYGMSPQLIDDAIADALEPASKVRFSEILATARQAVAPRRTRISGWTTVSCRKRCSLPCSIMAAVGVPRNGR